MERRKGLPSYPGSRSLYASLGILIFLEAIAIIIQAVYLARAITFLFEGKEVSSIVKELSLFLLFFLLRHGLMHVQRLLSERFAVRTVNTFREQLTDAYFKLGTRFAQKNGTGRLVTLAIEGIEQVKTYLEITIPRMIRTAIIPAVLAIYVFTLDKVSAVILVVMVPVIIVFMILLGMAAQKMADVQYKTYRILSNHFVDTLKGLETLTYLGESKKHEKKIHYVSERYRKATMKTLRVAFLSSFALDFFTSLSIAFVAVGLGSRLVDGAIVLLPALTILILAPEYFLPIRQVGTDYHATLDGQIALNQVEEIIQKKEKLTPPSQEEIIDWNKNPTLSLQNVTVSGDENTSILKDIHFSWQGNGKIGLVGESGAGKSTFIDLLAGFLQPSAGDVTVASINTSSFIRTDWTDQIAYIPQHPYIFPMSVKENIRFYEPDAKESDVERVVKEVGLDTLVKEFPNELDEKIGEGGRQLSGGQEQRVAMARALLSERPIILLDEPTAHLDIETEYEIKEAMLRLFEGKLIFLATHRTHWMREMDHLLVLENGRIVERGKHADLLANRKTYTNLVEPTQLTLNKQEGNHFEGMD